MLWYIKYALQPLVPKSNTKGQLKSEDLFGLCPLLPVTELVIFANNIQLTRSTLATAAKRGPFHSPAW